jgi:hypothetical protein
MNLQSIATLGLVAVVLAATAITPAEAHHHNNNKYLNQLAMQYYMQNQAGMGNAALYNPSMAAGYGNQYGSGAYGGMSPWGAGAMPYATTSSALPYAVNSAVPYMATSAVPYAATSALPYSVSNAQPFGSTVARFGSGLRNVAFNNAIASRFGNPALGNAFMGHNFRANAGANVPHFLR